MTSYKRIEGFNRPAKDNGVCSACFEFERESRTYIVFLKRSAETECAACAVLLRIIAHFKLTDGLEGEVRNAGSQEWEYYNASGDKCYWLTENDIAVHILPQAAHETEGTPAFVRFYLQGLRISPEARLFITSGEYKNISVLGFVSLTRIDCKSPWLAIGAAKDLPQFTSDSRCFITVHDWMTECSKKHTKCLSDRISKGNDELLPSRLLLLRNDDVKLVGARGQYGRYLTLSHCWGSSNNQPRTLRSNLQGRELGIPWDELNQTYRDAITITRQLGFEYIWIDSLCIVQYDMDDWEKESAQMASIYANSFLTICASRAKNGDSGIFMDRYDATNEHTKYTNHLTPFSIEVAKPVENGVLSTTRISARVVHKHYFQGMDNSFSRYESSAPTYWTPANKNEEPLFSRAWAFQERILAKRTLDFNAHELVWECQEMRRCECGETDARNFKTRKREITDAMNAISQDQNEQLHNVAPKTPRNDIWFRHVENFTTLDLTYKSDRLPALSGLAQALAPVKGEKYTAGIWHVDLPHALLWYSNPDGLQSGWSTHGSKSRYSKTPRERDVPSWSWASMEGPVIYELLHSIGATKVIARCDKVEHAAVGLDYYGRCNRARLTVHGPFVAAKLKYRLDAETHLWSTAKNTLFWIAAKETWFYVWPDLDYSDRDMDYWLGSTTDVWLLELLHSGDQSLGLILMSLGSNSDGEELYGRLGIFTLNTKYKLSLVDGKVVDNDVFTGSECRTVVLI